MCDLARRLPDRPDFVAGISAGAPRVKALDISDVTVVLAVPDPSLVHPLVFIVVVERVCIDLKLCPREELGQRLRVWLRPQEDDVVALDRVASVVRLRNQS